MIRTLNLLVILGLCVAASVPGLNSQESATRSPGHSYHGEVFNEGPRQRAYLMKGMPELSFPITTLNPETQRFFTQGVGQLHGFWYFEAERSFREASLLDPKAAMPFWGMAMANVNNAQRARGFLTNAVALKPSATPREQRLIESLNNYHQEEKDGKRRDKKQRRRDLIREYEKLVRDYPEDLEIRSLLIHQIWDNSGFGNSSDYPIGSHLAVDELTRSILQKYPQHPTHHYRIHLWDPENPEQALRSAALCGSGSLGIAHMWHMPGHTYAKLSRHDDAAWQQEASARVDHAYMIRDHVLPDQIHNYAHNNDWLVESWAFTGRVKEAIALAKNMVELPRLMKTNSVLTSQPKAHKYDFSRSSWQMGRNRLLSLLPKFELWDELIALSTTPYLEPTPIPEEQARRVVALGAAYFAKKDLIQARKQLQSLDEIQEVLKEHRNAAVNLAESNARKEKKPNDQVQKAMQDALSAFNGKMEKLESFRAELLALEALAEKNTNELAKHLPLAKDIPKIRLAQINQEAGWSSQAESLAKEAAQSATNQVLETAVYADILAAIGKKQEAEQTLKTLGSIYATVDLDLPVIKRLKPLLESASVDLTKAAGRRPDFGERPSIETLGPRHWTPPSAPTWNVTDARGKRHGSVDHKGRPYVAIFYLGRGCSHCMEQLNLFQDVAKEFEKNGVDLVAISTDEGDNLKETMTKASSRFLFPLCADPSREAFRAFHAYDGFEKAPLHGTFLVDAQGSIRWQDISYEPFLQAEFLIEEAKRLLSLSSSSGHAGKAKSKWTKKPAQHAGIRR